VVWASLSPDLKIFGTRTGMLSVPLAVGCLIGNPVAGALKKYDDYIRLQIFCGSILFGGMLFLLAARVAKAGARIAVKV
jgi:hypothetical protein